MDLKKPKWGYNLEQMEYLKMTQATQLIMQRQAKYA
jgi:hypothetical protein